MDKWMTKKFQHSQKERAIVKQTYFKNGSFKLLGTANHNCTRAALKRRYSRGSAPAFQTVDVELNGNTASVNHLIKHARGPNNHAPQDLNFEVNLRTYKPSEAGPKHSEPFKFPKPAEIVDPVQTFKG